VVVQNGGEPRLRRSRRVELRLNQLDIERCVIGLPDCIWVAGLATVNQLESVAIGVGALMSQGHEIGRQVADYVMDQIIAGRFFSQTFRC
jgi:hypothetical protein